MIRFVRFCFRFCLRFCLRFGLAKRGATAIEYAFLIGLISITLIGAITMLGEGVVGLFGGISSDVSAIEANISDLGNCGDGEGDGSALCDNK